MKIIQNSLILQHTTGIEIQEGSGKIKILQKRVVYRDGLRKIDFYEVGSRFTEDMAGLEGERSEKDGQA